MKAHCESIPYKDTGYFSKLVIDYLNQEAGLEEFYLHPASTAGLMAALKARQLFKQDRELLVSALTDQYKGLQLSDAVSANINLLKASTTFTITTAHQPNILTGPLYFIYKILHTIRLAAKLKKEFGEYDFVPVYYMGSEDADLDELGHIFLNGEKLEWETKQEGAVGRMHTKGIDKLIDRLEGEFGGMPFGNEMVTLCRQAYSSDKNIQQATLYLVNELFRSYGLVVVIPDSPLLKRPFNQVIEKELTTRFSHPLVQQTIEKIGEHYKAQAAGREINLFYLSDDGSRERIELRQPITVAGEMILQVDNEEEVEFIVVNRNLSFTRQAILKELDEHPERFSANVILRGVFQETILPNIAFIGGGGELAYWMELRKVFEAVDVPFPVLLLRNSFLIVPTKYKQLQQKLGVSTTALFSEKDVLINQLVAEISKHKLSTKESQDIAYTLYEQLQEQTSEIDPTLKAHVAALHVRTQKGLLNLEKKFLRAEKRKHGDIINQVNKLKGALFPNNSLQERIENFMPFYARYGKAILDKLYEASQPFTDGFSVLYIDDADE